MPKIKSKKGVRKRFKVTARGKVKAARAGKSHLLTGKSRARKRSLRGKNVIEGARARMIRKGLQ